MSTVEEEVERFSPKKKGEVKEALLLLLLEVCGRRRDGLHPQQGNRLILSHTGAAHPRPGWREAEPNRAVREHGSQLFVRRRSALIQTGCELL